MSDQTAATQAVDVTTLTFDEALVELQRTVAELEQGGLELERSIELYERGVALHERCAGLLGQAELRVQRLLERSAGQLAAVESRSEEQAE
ncbi:MAG: exodeoxyribonuclease VII small subunit [Candidatus Limnocylindrales bacterium]|jgi:exodeoxyribonuclease VII small subunit